MYLFRFHEKSYNVFQIRSTFYEPRRSCTILCRVRRESKNLLLLIKYWCLNLVAHSIAKNETREAPIKRNCSGRKWITNARTALDEKKKKNLYNYYTDLCFALYSIANRARTIKPLIIMDHFFTFSLCHSINNILSWIMH